MLPALDDSDNEITDYLKQQFEDFTSRALHPQDIVAPNGPYRMALEFLFQPKNSENSQNLNAKSRIQPGNAKMIIINHDLAVSKLVLSFNEDRYSDMKVNFKLNSS